MSGNRSNVLVLGFHMPAAVAAELASRLDLDRAGALPDIIGDDDVGGRHAHRRERRDQATAQQLGHDIMFASGAKER